MIAGKSFKKNDTKRKQIGDYLAAFGLPFGVYNGNCGRHYATHQFGTFDDRLAPNHGYLSAAHGSQMERSL
jgi:hypothetical protein